MKKIFNILKNLIVFISKVIAVTALALAVLYAYYQLMNIIFKNFLPQMSVWVLANFVLFAGILYYVIFRKIHAPEQIAKIQDEIAETIENSETAKTESEENLSQIEKSMENISNEIDLILRQSDDNAKLVGAKISEDTNSAVAVIQQNTRNLIENNHVILKNDILRRASMASVEVARAYIIEELRKNTELHEKLIDESLNAIEGAEI